MFFVSAFLSQDSDFQSLNKSKKINKTLFNDTVAIILEKIGERAFKTSNSINKSVCDSLLVGIAQIIMDKKDVSEIKVNYNRLIDDEEYKKYVTASTSSPTHVLGRIDLARNYLLGRK